MSTRTLIGLLCIVAGVALVGHAITTRKKRPDRD
jgi:uncharacterized membrane protein HdeD (DUF308 family)